MRNTIKKIWSVLTTLLIIAVALLALLLVGARLFGFQLYAVLSGSMEPAYRTGSVIYVRETDAAELEVGDVITFRLTGDAVATHRVVEIVGGEENPKFRTKGDANDVADGSLVSAEDIVGKVIFSVPYLGYAVEFIQTPKGRYTAIAVGALVLLLLILPDVLFSSNQGEEQAEKQTEKQEQARET